MFVIYEASVAEFLMRETHNFWVAGRIRDVAEFLLIRGLFLVFLIALHRAFCCVLVGVCEAELRMCV